LFKRKVSYTNSHKTRVSRRVGHRESKKRATFGEIAGDNRNGLEEGMVFGFGVDPVEDFGDLRVVGLVGVDINEVK
jgi:hypothetical protein